MLEEERERGVLRGCWSVEEKGRSNEGHTGAEKGGEERQSGQGRVEGWMERRGGSQASWEVGGGSRV